MGDDSKQEGRIKKLQELRLCCNYISSFVLIISKLRLFWLVSLSLGLLVAIKGPNLSETGDCDFLLYVGGAVMGFASSAFFSCHNEFLRGVKDQVYFVRNLPLGPRVYPLAGRKTFNALVGEWEGVLNLPEKIINCLCLSGCLCFCKERNYNITSADLCKLSDEDEKSNYVIFCGLRFGVPDMATRYAIWGDTEPKKPKKRSIYELEQWSPGGGLVSVYKWPEEDRHKAAEVLLCISLQKYVEGDFNSAKKEIDRAHRLDPNNPRIAHFSNAILAGSS